MGTETPPKAGSGSWPAWITLVYLDRSSRRSLDCQPLPQRSRRQYLRPVLSRGYRHRERGVHLCYRLSSFPWFLYHTQGNKELNRNVSQGDFPGLDLAGLEDILSCFSPATSSKTAAGCSGTASTAFGPMNVFALALRTTLRSHRAVRDFPVMAAIVTSEFSHLSHAVDTSFNFYGL